MLFHSQTCVFGLKTSVFVRRLPLSRATRGRRLHVSAGLSFLFQHPGGFYGLVSSADLVKVWQAPSGPLDTVSARGCCCVFRF